MPNRPNFLVVLALVAPFVFMSASPDKPAKGKKDKGPFVAGKPAFTPDPETPAFDLSLIHI